MHKLLVLLLMALMINLFPLRLSAQPELNAARVDRNIVYGMYSGLALLMDVYHPENPNGYGIIHISGSGWTRDLSLDAGLLNHAVHVKIEGEAFVEAGYTLFSINHRAVPRFIYPAAVEDAQRAVRFIRYHADKYGISPDRIGAMGGSSGGHLVSMLGVLDGNELLMDDTPINRMSAKVQCIIARAAPTNFLAEDSEVGVSFLGVDLKKDPSTIEYKRAQKASPINYISADDPPFLLIHGDNDKVVPFTLSEDMYKKLQEMKVTSKLVTVEGGVHGANIVNTPDMKKEMVQWMDQYLIEK